MAPAGKSSTWVSETDQPRVQGQSGLSIKTEVEKETLKKE